MGPMGPMKNIDKHSIYYFDKLIILIITLNLLKEPFNVFANYFQAIVKIQKISLVIIISKIALIILKLLLIYLKYSLISFVEDMSLFIRSSL